MHRKKYGKKKMKKIFFYLCFYALVEGKTCWQDSDLSINHSMNHSVNQSNWFRIIHYKIHLHKKINLKKDRKQPKDKWKSNGKTSVR